MSLSKPQEPRFAVYFTPEPETPLAGFGNRWLGRDPVTGAPVSQPVLTDIDPVRLREVTQAPRFYGFHATLKAPFELADGCDRQSLVAAVRAFADRQSGFSVRLKVASIREFVALVLAEDCPRMTDLASMVVRDFEPYRAPLGDHDRERRLHDGLGDRQRRNVERWGYASVFEDFRFHMTLTGSIDSRIRERVERQVSVLAAPILSHPVPIDGIAVFWQPDRETPFRVIARYPFAGG